MFPKVIELASPPSVDCLIEQFGSRRLPFVLDSSLSNDGLGQFSFFGADPFLVFTGKDGQYETQSPDGTESLVGDGLAIMRDLMSQHKIDNNQPIPFCGGAVGFLSYDYGRQIERVPQLAEDDRDVPDLHFGFYDGIAALNHETGILSLIALGIRADPDLVLAELKAIIESPFKKSGEAPIQRHGEWQWNMSHETFLNTVERVRSYIASGDVYQVNLSQRARCSYEGNAIQLYQALRNGNPAPYSAYIDTGELAILSTSPEQLIRKQGRQLETRPIKGTRPRGANTEEDQRNANALLCSEKDRAELLMIVDLERNDLGRVAEIGSVKVDQLYHLEHYARVIHQTAQVKAQLAEDRDIFDCIKALFPGGSITGAPKIRAMEIIEELEPTRRGAYTGSVGYIGFDGNAELNIAIRSLHLKDGFLDYQVGSGIVWDSDPESEYQETLDKGRAIRETIDKLCQLGTMT
ncbi:aminodeoxychorismate synthase component I [Rubellicoccus peritrichatus]|uniref:aminodeoxychorismate synthase n=1 Tax=Rubellicoccus peritrichatus TaxID=3080537 RepID=A0AAQ3QVQ9_9BACT|nr:aminodeoxychorismate synthase component I [Puniceicoccus sp. CR14]WOO41160.1 aminodeoxychorismate synthase component I [Puniceicoccus sp. CR14]